MNMTSFGRDARIALVQGLLLVVVTSAGCGPSDSDARIAFQAANPDHVVDQVFGGEGDGGNVYKHIRFRVPGKAELCEVVWLYQHVDDRWTVTLMSTAVASGRPAAQFHPADSAHARGGRTSGCS